MVIGGFLQSLAVGVLPLASCFECPSRTSADTTPSVARVLLPCVGRGGSCFQVPLIFSWLRGTSHMPHRGGRSLKVTFQCQCSAFGYGSVDRPKIGLHSLCAASRGGWIVSVNSACMGGSDSSVSTASVKWSINNEVLDTHCGLDTVLSPVCVRVCVWEIQTTLLL